MTVDWEERQQRLSEERGTAEARTAPRWIQVQTWPDANGERGLRWIDVNKPQPPEWWEPQLLSPLPPPRALVLTSLIAATCGNVLCLCRR